MAGRKRLGLFLGAGASLATPSSLPTFQNIKASWISKLAQLIAYLPDDRKDFLLPLIDQTPPEVMFQMIDEVDRANLLKALDVILYWDKKPNANHLIAAEVIKRGGVVWTTNFDTLIEEAFNISPIDCSQVAFNAFNPTPFLEPRIRLLKPHGTLAVPRSLIFRSNDVLRNLPSPVQQRLKQDVGECFFAILGYSGADVDMYPLLRNALEINGDAIWFCLREDEKKLKERFLQANENGNLVFVGSDNPSISFWKWAESLGLLISTPNWLSPKPDIFALEILLDNPIVQANLFQRLRAFDVASAILKPSVFQSRKATLGYLRAIRYQYKPIGMLFAFFWYSLQVLIPTKTDKALYSLSYLAFDSGRYATGKLISGFNLKNASIKRRIQHAACLRMLGEYKRTEYILRSSLDKAVSSGDANEEARVTFELAITLRWMGREEEAISVIQSMSRDRILHADPNWEGWLKFEEGTCLSLKGELFEAFIDAERAEEIFNSIKYTQPLGLIDTKILKCTLARLKGNTTMAKSIIKEIRAELVPNRLGRRLFSEEALSFEEAEVARQEVRYDIAERLYRSLLSSKSRLHVNHGNLGLAELDRAKGNHQSAALLAEKSLQGYSDLNSLCGVNNAILTLVLCDKLTWNDGEAIAKATGYILPGNSLKGLLFGFAPSNRALNLP